MFKIEEYVAFGFVVAVLYHAMYLILQLSTINWALTMSQLVR